MSLIHRPDLWLFVLVSLECILGFVPAECLRIICRPRSTLKPQFLLAVVVGLAVYCINVFNIGLQHETGHALPSLASSFDSLTPAVLLYPLMAGLGWVGILDTRRILLEMAAERRRRRQRP